MTPEEFFKFAVELEPGTILQTSNGTIIERTEDEIRVIIQGEKSILPVSPRTA